MDFNQLSARVQEWSVLQRRADDMMCSINDDIASIMSGGVAMSHEQAEVHLFTPKFTTTQLNRDIHKIRGQYPNKSVVVLTDSLDIINSEYFICSPNSINDFGGKFDFAKTLFLYACLSDEIGLPYIEMIHQRGGQFYPVQVFTPSSYADINETARLVLESEYTRQNAEGFAKFDFGAGDFLNIIQAIEITKNIPGEYVEIGCFEGSSASIAVRYMRDKAIKRECYFLDVFSGFTYSAAQTSADVMWSSTHITNGINVTAQRIEMFNSPANGPLAHVVRCNVIEEELPDAIRNIVIANIDVDMLEAVESALLKVAPKIVRRGIIIVEDPGHTPALIGARFALNKFMESDMGKQFVPIYMESGQTFLIKI